ncbi:MAG: hypothetical protein K6T74_10495 [Geminicoccaceae bacterium]|nr:hypothetical protein [Geminicoccaceae bacterium]
MRATGERFAVLREIEHAWRPLLARPEYRPELADDHYGLLYLVARRGCRLRTVADR